MTVLTGLTDVVTRLGTPGTVFLERASGVSTNSEGVAVRAGPSVSMMAPTVVHPIAGRDRVLLPEGVRTDETIVTYAVEPLRTARENAELADVLIHRPLLESESRYIVQTVENWGHVSGHWRVFSTREPGG